MLQSLHEDESWSDDKKSAIIIPEDGHNWGWGDIAGKILWFLGKPSNPRFNKLIHNTKSFMDVANIPKW